MESYHASELSTSQIHDKQAQNVATSSVEYYSQQGANAQFVMESRSTAHSTVAQQSSGEFNMYSHSQGGQLSFDSPGPLTVHEQMSSNNDNSNWVGGLKKVSEENSFQLVNRTQQSTDFYNNQLPVSVGQPLFSNGHHVAYSPSEGKSSAGRPPHALVTFGFGGKLVVMKDTTVGFSSLGSKV